jgi:hypothetical protein
VHIPELVSLSTHQYRPSFMPGNEHHQIIFYMLTALGLIN